MLKTLKLFAAYLASMLLGVYFGFVSYMFGLLGQQGGSDAWLWNLESTLAAFIGLCLFFGPIVYDIFWLDNGRNAS